MGRAKTLSAPATSALPPVAALMFSVPRHVPHSQHSPVKSGFFQPVFKPPRVRAVSVLLVAPAAPGQPNPGRISNTAGAIISTRSILHHIETRDTDHALILATLEGRSPGRLQLTVRRQYCPVQHQAGRDGLAKQKQLLLPLSLKDILFLTLQATATPDPFGKLDLKCEAKRVLCCSQL